MELKCQKLSDIAFLPTRASEMASGVDLYSPADATIPPHNSIILDTDIAVQLPEGTYGRIAPRSGLAAKHQINILGGVIDVDFRDSIKVIIFNHSDAQYNIKRGHRIAQLICEQIVYANIVEVNTLPKTNRNKGCLGSSGL